MKKLLAHIDFLLPGLVLMILVARFFPFQPEYSAVFPMKEITFWGIVLVFLLYGFKLSPNELLRDLSNWRLHVLTQATAFVILPLLIIALYPFFKNSDYFDFWLALFFLSVLPSTVSMSVVFVVKNNGNLGGAIFNSSISGFLGMILTPLWMSVFMHEAVSGDERLDLILKLVQQIFVPVVLGMSVRHFLPHVALWCLKKFKNFDKMIVLLIVYSSFSNAFNNDLFSVVPLSQMLILVAGVVSLYLVVFELSQFFGRILKFSQEDQIVLLFCGTQKSLVHGSVFALLLFQEAEMQTFALLPLMIYHAFQLLFASYKSIVWVR